MKSFLRDLKHWRERAEETRAKAAQFFYKESEKQRLLRIAAEYDRLADRAVEVFAIYVTPFLIIGLAIKFLMTRYGVSLSEVERQAGPKPKRRFLLGAWRTDE